MAEHYNLYYLFWEDCRNHPLRPEKDREIQKIIQLFYQKQNPPRPPPPESKKENN